MIMSDERSNDNSCYNCIHYHQKAFGESCQFDPDDYMLVCPEWKGLPEKEEISSCNNCTYCPTFGKSCMFDPDDYGLVCSKWKKGGKLINS